MLTLLTEPLSWYLRFIFYVKKILKRVFFLKIFGPMAVVDSLIKWLRDTPNIIWNHNPNEHDLYETVYVPVDILALKYALILKKKNVIKKLIVWPNITIPLSRDDIFFDPNIDIIVVPSRWLQDYFYSLLWCKDPRIIIVPAGVDINKSSHNPQDIILYKKNCPEHLFIFVRDFLEKNNHKYSLFVYGDFNHDDFLRALDNSKGLIYLQTSESQWIALHEAWMRDVPTLVWNQWYWEYKGMIWKDSHISAPYLTDECGDFFESEKDFPTAFNLFFSKFHLYSPKAYCMREFSHEIALKHLISYL